MSAIRLVWLITNTVWKAHYLIKSSSNTRNHLRILDIAHDHSTKDHPVASDIQVHRNQAKLGRWINQSINQSEQIDWRYSSKRWVTMWIGMTSKITECLIMPLMITRLSCCWLTEWYEEPGEMISWLIDRPVTWLIGDLIDKLMSLLHLRIIWTINWWKDRCPTWIIWHTCTIHRTHITNTRSRLTVWFI